MKLISFVIPVFNNEGSLKITYNNNKKALKTFLKEHDYEFIFVDDGSTDNSLQELLSLRKGDNKVQIIQFSRNFGQKMAVVAGLNEAKGDVTICMSADLQDPPEMISNMLKEFEKGTEIVVCYRNTREEELLKRLRSQIYYYLLKITYPSVPKGGFDYFALSKKPLEAYKKLEDRNRVTQVDILWLGFNIKFLPYKRKKRVIGKSQYTFSKYLKSFVDGIVDGSYVPIRFISLTGIVTATLGFSYVLVVVFRYFKGETPFRGYAPIIILLLIIGGLTMLMLGILGEYIARIYHETRKRPHYIIKNKYG